METDTLRMDAVLRMDLDEFTDCLQDLTLNELRERAGQYANLRNLLPARPSYCNLAQLREGMVAWHRANAEAYREAKADAVPEAQPFIIAARMPASYEELTDKLKSMRDLANNAMVLRSLPIATTEPLQANFLPHLDDIADIMAEEPNYCPECLGNGMDFETGAPCEACQSHPEESASAGFSGHMLAQAAFGIQDIGCESVLKGFGLEDALKEGEVQDALSAKLASGKQGRKPKHTAEEVEALRKQHEAIVAGPECMADKVRSLNSLGLSKSLIRGILQCTPQSVHNSIARSPKYGKQKEAGEIYARQDVQDALASNSRQRDKFQALWDLGFDRAHVARLVTLWYKDSGVTDETGAPRVVEYQHVNNWRIRQKGGATDA